MKSSQCPPPSFRTDYKSNMEPNSSIAQMTASPSGLGYQLLACGDFLCNSERLQSVLVDKGCNTNRLSSIQNQLLAHVHKTHISSCPYMSTLDTNYQVACAGVEPDLSSLRNWRPHRKSNRPHHCFELSKNSSQPGRKPGCYESRAASENRTRLPTLATLCFTTKQ